MNAITQLRRLTALAILCAAAACGSLLGPSQPELERAIHDFYASGEHPGAPGVATARISGYEGCQPLNGTFRCPVVFSTEQGEVATTIWIARAPSGGWQVRNIALIERPR